MDSFLSKKSTRERIDPATENKQVDIETRLLELLDLTNDNLVAAVGANPVEGSGQSLAAASANTDYKVTVVAGGSYLFTSMLTGGYYFGLADTQLAHNVRWCCPLYNTVLIKIPAGYTELHYATTTGSEVGYLRRVL